MKKTMIVIMAVLLAISVAAYSERWDSSFKVKNLVTTTFYDASLLDLIEEDILTESNTLVGSAFVEYAEDGDYMNSRVNYRGSIQLEDGEITYFLSDFEEEFVDVFDGVTQIDGQGYITYTLTIRKEIPVSASFLLQDEEVAEVFIDGEDFQYQSYDNYQPVFERHLTKYSG